AKYLKDISLKSLVLFLFLYQTSLVYIPNKNKFFKKLRNKKLLEDYSNSNITINELAKKYKISTRTVYRIINNGI
ncbi:MAG TPA: Mor transcription activator family protein, partial [Spirochaetota bacterium]|nr:Mor transcription activator family protein [Spirochaetota bacterium]